MNINSQSSYIYVYVKNNKPREHSFSDIDEAIESACTDLELGEIRPVAIMDGNRNIIYYYDQIVKEWRQRYDSHKYDKSGVL